MKYLPEVLLSISTCVFGLWGSAFIKESNRKVVCRRAFIFALITLVLAAAAFFRRDKQQEETLQLKKELCLMECYNLFKNEEYSDALDTVVECDINDAQIDMVYAYFLANGYGVDKNIPLSIMYYNKANAKGEPRAISNMVASVAKNCYSAEKIEAIKCAYDAGNEMAIEYVNYVVQSWNSNPANENAPISQDEIWSLDQATLLAILNGPFYRWIGTNVTYTTSVSTTSTPTFTRRFLYQIGDKRVYEECSLIVNNDFPDWLQEDVW